MKKQIVLGLAVGCLMLSGCEGEMPVLGEKDTAGATVYTIPAGSHSANESGYQLLNAAELKFKARFDSSAIYQSVDRANQQDINKLYGMSDCNSHHQTNSARFGWRWFQNSLEIWAYTYSNGERNFNFISTVPLNTFSSYGISFTDSSYVFKVNESGVSLARHCTNDASGYRLYPYFGGDEVAPHDITIEIEDIP